MTLVEGSFDVTSWDEKAYLEIDERRRFARATVSENLTGAISGRATVEYLLCYADDAHASFVALRQLEGSVNERSGSLAMRVIGDFDGQNATGEWTVVPGSGTGELAGIEGSGTFRAPLGPSGTYSLQMSVP